MGDMPSPGGMLGPIAVERPKGGRGDVGVLGTPVGDHERTRVSEERGGEADKENDTEGEECMKLELERKEKTRARKISRFRRGRSRRAGLKKGVGEAWKLERSGKVLMMNYPEAIMGLGESETENLPVG